MVKSLKTKENSTSAGRVLAVLRRAPMTVEELVTTLGVTRTAVRNQLMVLERDGLIERGSSRRGAGAGKPAFTYVTTAEADRVCSRAYIPVLTELTRLLPERLKPEDVGALFGEVGRRLGAENGPGDLDDVVAELTELGGVISRERVGKATCISSASCPLGDVVKVVPETCRIVESFIAAVTGRIVHEQCVREKRLKCRFLVE